MSLFIEKLALALTNLKVLDLLIEEIQGLNLKLELIRQEASILEIEHLLAHASIPLDRQYHFLCVWYQNIELQMAQNKHNDFGKDLLTLLDKKLCQLDEFTIQEQANIKKQLDQNQDAKIDFEQLPSFYTKSFSFTEKKQLQLLLKPNLDDINLFTEYKKINLPRIKSSPLSEPLKLRLIELKLPLSVYFKYSHQLFKQGFSTEEIERIINKSSRMVLTSLVNHSQLLLSYGYQIHHLITISSKTDNNTYFDLMLKYTEPLLKAGLNIETIFLWLNNSLGAFELCAHYYHQLAERGYANKLNTIFNRTYAKNLLQKILGLPEYRQTKHLIALDAPEKNWYHCAEEQKLYYLFSKINSPSSFTNKCKEFFYLQRLFNLTGEIERIHDCLVIRIDTCLWYEFFPRIPFPKQQMQPSDSLIKIWEKERYFNLASHPSYVIIKCDSHVQARFNHNALLAFKLGEIVKNPKSITKLITEIREEFILIRDYEFLISLLNKHLPAHSLLIPKKELPTISLPSCVETTASELFDNRHQFYLNPISTPQERLNLNLEDRVSP